MYTCDRSVTTEQHAKLEKIALARRRQQEGVAASSKKGSGGRKSRKKKILSSARGSGEGADAERKGLCGEVEEGERDGVEGMVGVGRDGDLDRYLERDNDLDRYFFETTTLVGFWSWLSPTPSNFSLPLPSPLVSAPGAASASMAAAAGSVSIHGEGHLYEAGHIHGVGHLQCSSGVSVPQRLFDKVVFPSLPHVVSACVAGDTSCV